MSVKKNKMKYLLFANVAVVLLSFIAILLEKTYDLNYGNGDGIILKWNIHGKLILIQFVSILFLVNILLFKSKSENLKNLGVALFSTIFFTISLELIFGLMLFFKSDSHQVSTRYFTAKNLKKSVVPNIFDKELGYKTSEKEIFARKSLMKNQESIVVYDIKYSFDKYNRRINPSNSVHRKNKKFALFFGGSYTLGEGVNDNENLPFHFVREDSTYISYNYGFGGYGPQQMLSNLNKPNIVEGIKEEKGVCFYLYINPHVKRANGFFNVFTKFGAFTPYYRIEKGRAYHEGNFIEGRPLISYFYFLLSNSNILKYFKIDFPLKITTKHYEITASIIKESYKTYLKKFGQKNDFYLIIYPGNSGKIIDYLNDTGIQILRYENLFENLDQYKIHSPYEGHPNTRAFEQLAKEINKDIKL